MSRKGHKGSDPNTPHAHAVDQGNQGQNYNPNISSSRYYFNQYTRTQNTENTGRHDTGRPNNKKRPGGRLIYNRTMNSEQFETVEPGIVVDAAQQSTARLSRTRRSSAEHGAAQQGTAQLSRARRNATQHSTEQFGTVVLGTARRRSAGHDAAQRLEHGAAQQCTARPRARALSFACVCVRVCARAH